MLRFENEFAGLTVLYVLKSVLGLSRKAITDLKGRKDGILINDSHVTVRATIKEGDVLTINCDDEEENENLIPSSTLPNIIFEDEHIVVVNKPADMPTHPSHNHYNDTVANSLAYYYKLKSRPFVFRSVNRLDRNTSGAVLVAKNRISAYKLSKQMKSGGIKKTYIAILDGIPERKSGRIETYIRRKEESIIFREVCEKREDAKLAITDYTVIAEGNGLSCVIATPVTGRTHQLRLHFAHLGCPILGDDLYGEPSDLIGRHALHAYKLEFQHPDSQAPLCIAAELCEDMKRIIKENFDMELADNENNR